MNCTRIHFNFSCARAWTCAVCMCSKFYSSPCPFAMILDLMQFNQNSLVHNFFGANSFVHKLFLGTSDPGFGNLVHLCTSGYGHCGHVQQHFLGSGTVSGHNRDAYRSWHFGARQMRCIAVHGFLCAHLFNIHWHFLNFASVSSGCISCTPT